MFKIDSAKNIHMNRGDTITIKLENNTDEFAVGDKITFYIVTKGDYTDVLLKKEYTVTEAATTFSITIDSADTKGSGFPALKNTFAIYWYEIELNSEGAVSTIIGQDTQGPKLFYMYPEAVQTSSNN